MFIFKTSNVMAWTNLYPKNELYYTGCFSITDRWPKEKVSEQFNIIDLDWTYATFVPSKNF